VRPLPLPPARAFSISLLPPLPADVRFSTARDKTTTTLTSLLDDDVNLLRRCSGFDGSVMSGFFGIASFLSDMDDPDASKQGLLTAAISLGCASSFVSPHESARRLSSQVRSATLLTSPLDDRLS
jgi:hypothetical protein